MLHSLSFSKHMTTTFHNKLTQLINFLISLGINMLQLWSQVTPMFSPVWELVGEAVILRVRSQAHSNSIWELVGEAVILRVRSQARTSSIWQLLERCSKVCIIFQESWRTSFIQKQILLLAKTEKASNDITWITTAFSGSNFQRWKEKKRASA